MSTTYYQLDWHHDFKTDPIMFFYETQSSNAVTRLVEVFRDGQAISDSLNIAAKRERKLVNNVCLCDGGFEPAVQAQQSDGTEFDFKAISKKQFDEHFDKAEPKLSEGQKQ